MALQDIKHLVSYMDAIEYVNEVTVYTNPQRAKEIDREINKIWDAINAIREIAYDFPEQPNYVKVAIGILDAQYKALCLEHQKLVDEEATEIAKSKRRHEVFRPDIM